MNKNYYFLIAMLMVVFTPLSMNAFGTNPTANSNTEKRFLTGCDGVTITGGNGTITIAGLGSYSHIQIFTPGFTSQVFNQELTTPSIIVPISLAGDYIVKVWSNPDPTVFCENNFPVTVGAGNSNAPVANPDNATTPQSTAVPISILNNDNLNGGTLQMVMLVTNPANGGVVLNGANQFVYTPNAGFSGTDQFTYKIVASNGTSNTTTVTITVPSPQQLQPVANPDNATTNQNTAVTIPVVNNDVLNGTFTMLVVMTQPANGSAAVSGNQIVYTPRAGFCGTDNFTYKLVTSSGSSITSVSVIVNCPTPAPVANNDNATTPQGTPVTIPVLGNDNLNGGIIQMVMLVTAPLNGTVTLNTSNQYVYTPNAGFFGMDQFMYKVVASNGTSNVATVTVIVPQNQPAPVANNDNATTSQGTPVTIPVLGNDNLNGGNLQMIMLVNAPLNGTVALNASNQYVYTPNAGFFGIDQFTYKVVASNGTSNVATVTVTVPQNQPAPVANNDNATTPKGTPVTIPVLGNDNLNGGTIQMVMLVSSPANGTVTLNAANQYVYTPNAGFVGTNQFTYKVVASNGTSNIATVTVTITDPCANDITPPVITCPANMSKTPTNGGTCWTNFTWNAATATDNCSTPSVTQIAGPASGSCIGYGVSTITYKATDAKGNLATCSFTVTINRPVDLCATDVTPPVITCPANMSKTPTNGGTCWTNFTWYAATATDNCSTPYVNQIAGPTSGSCIGYGVSTITYKATDAKGNSATCSFTVTVNRPTCNYPVVDFKNNTNCTLNLYWINNWGQKVWYKTIYAWQTHSQSTYSGHRWLMCCSNGSVVHDYTANSNCSQSTTANSCSNGWWWLATNDVLTLEAKAELNRNRIDFVSNTGIQNDYLTVEKANQTSGDFETLELVNNKSTTNENQYYSVYDNNPVEGDNIYRVKVTYLDGTTKISDTKTVNFKATQGVSVYPNPAVESVSVDLSKYKGQAVTVALFNNFGQQVLTQSVDKASGSLSLDIAQFSAGNYRLRIVSKGKKDVVQQLNIAK